MAKRSKSAVCKYAGSMNEREDKALQHNSGENIALQSAGSRRWLVEQEKIATKAATAKEEQIRSIFKKQGIGSNTIVKTE
eukprot:CAMPEP_0119325394 /NCGR_PEP_ID=MMETSP1333-20130426/65695_1 /TAXON_ID=418940 /ORGANISM="Scyphosphaera apsteinii, Strain RCC1455" /LENGTH=79 /DNA_ID=CAMNT_0007333371 /DNA_START=18 /DNA_END=257 /DNA_ORIENTATION=-